MELSIYNIQGKETGRKIVLDESIFGVEPNDHAIYLAVKLIMANKRQGTAKSKERSEVSGSTRKLGKQKGGGGARRGDINSPVLVGGGRVFGPVPRSYSFKLNKKVKSLARKSALTYKAKDNNIIVLDNINFDAPKTKNVVSLTNNLKVADKKSLIVLSDINKNVYLSARNLGNVEIISVANLNTYKILNANVLLMDAGSISILENNLNA